MSLHDLPQILEPGAPDAGFAPGAFDFSIGR